VLFARTQEVLPNDSKITKPAPGSPYGYGSKQSYDPALIMPPAAEHLFNHYSQNRYTTYPTGFYKVVKLNQTKRRKMGGILAELSTGGMPDIQQAQGETADIGIAGGITADARGLTLEMSGGAIVQNEDGSFQIVAQETAVPDRGAFNVSSFQLNPDITWERFSELMKQADKLLGGGSDYSEMWMTHRFGFIPLTYEEALADYELTVSRDRISGAYARLFTDYMTIILGLLPVFPAVFFCLADRRTITPVLYTRRISSARFVLTRFLALSAATILPVLLMGAALTVKAAADYGAANIDVPAYIKYAFFWSFPTALASIAVGMFFTTLTNTPIAIALQLGWWFADFMAVNGEFSYYGARRLQLMPRHNGFGRTGAYLDYLPALIQNRIIITCIAVLLVILTIFVFNAKRKGSLDVSVFKRGGVRPAL
jgi:hypothetical protein